IYSQPGKGTAIYALLTGDGARLASPPPTCGLRAAKPGQEVCGDDWGARRRRSLHTIAVADGLGHGPEAFESSRAAIAVFNNSREAGPRELLEVIHAGIRHTRGAAVSIAELDEERRTITFAGLGNVSGRICDRDGQNRHMVSMNGTAGMEGRHIF